MVLHDSLPAIGKPSVWLRVLMFGWNGQPKCNDLKGWRHPNMPRCWTQERALAVFTRKKIHRADANEAVSPVHADYRTPPIDGSERYRSMGPSGGVAHDAGLQSSFRVTPRLPDRARTWPATPGPRRYPQAPLDRTSESRFPRSLIHRVPPRT